MYLELNDDAFKQAVREEIAKVITRDTQNENKEFVKEIIQQALRDMWSTEQPSFQATFKKMLADSWGFKDKVVEAIEKGVKPLLIGLDAESVVSKYITEEMIGKVVAEKVAKILETPNSNKKIEEYMAAKIQEIFMRKFMMQQIKGDVDGR